MSDANFIEDDEDMTVTLTSEDGEEIDCAVIAIFPVKEQDYIALLPLPEDIDEMDIDEDEELEGEILLYRYEETGEEDIDLTPLESDEEISIVTEAFNQILEEMSEEE